MDAESQNLAGWVKALAWGLAGVLFGGGVWVGRSSLTMESHAERLDAHDETMMQTAELLSSIEARLAAQGSRFAPLEATDTRHERVLDELIRRHYGQE